MVAPWVCAGGEGKDHGAGVAPLASLGLRALTFTLQAIPLEPCWLLDQICFSHDEKGRFL